MASVRSASRMLCRPLFNTASASSSFSTRTFRPTSILPTYASHARRHKTGPGAKPEKLPPSTPGPNATGDDRAYRDHGPGEPTEPLDSGIRPSTIYNFEDIQQLSEHPSPDRILIDVREPSELLGTGRIPTALNVPISSAPDSFFLSAEDFEERFGFPRPGETQEVVFYCKAGVRSKAAARLAQQAGFGGRTGEFPGSWVEWAGKGGRVDRE